MLSVLLPQRAPASVPPAVLLPRRGPPPAERGERAPQQQRPMARVEVHVEGHEGHESHSHTREVRETRQETRTREEHRHEERETRGSERRPSAPKRSRPSRGDADRIETIEKTGRTVDREVKKAGRVMNNIGYQIELGGYAHERGVFPRKLIPYLYGRLEHVTSEGVRAAAIESAFGSIVAYEGTSSGRGKVYQAVKRQIDYGADAACATDGQARLIRQSIDALDKLSRKPPTNPCRE